jgi:hypothetical protein
MQYLRRLAIAVGLLTILVFPATAGAQTVIQNGLTLMASDPTTPPVRMSDIAFLGNRAYVGNYSGFRIYDISNPAAPQRLVDFVCSATPGGAGQGDVSVWRANGRTLLFRSVDSPQNKPQCDRIPRSCSATVTTDCGWEGIDIFDVTNPAAPSLIRSVATDCGSHTHTLVPDEANGRVLLYISSYPLSGLTPAGMAQTPFGTECRQDGAGHDKISIVQVPLNAPETSSVIAEPKLGLTGGILGLPGAKGCHDISVFMEIKLAAGACLTDGLMLDISNPAAPTVKNKLVNPAIDSCAQAAPPAGQQLCLWHSATFTWDGKYVVFGDEAGGGGGSECAQDDPQTKGAFWIHSVANPTSPIQSFKIPRPQPAVNSSYQNCTAHIMNFVPINGRYVLPSSWYSGGTSVIDWTNPSAPNEIAHFEVEPGALGAADPAQTNTWTTYWYNDFMYTADGGGAPNQAGTSNGGQRGFEVMRLDQPWRTYAWNLQRFNPQTQENLMRCRVMAHGSVRAKQRGMVHVQVRVLGQPVVGTKVNVRASGVRMSKTTNTSGEAMFTVRAARKGTLRVNVPAVPNMLGCQTSKRVAAARQGNAGAGAGGPALTGRTR